MVTVKAILLPMLLVTMACRRADPILPEEAKDHIGEDVSVRGLVEQVSFSKKGHAFLNFGGKYPSMFSRDSCRLERTPDRQTQMRELKACFGTTYGSKRTNSRVVCRDGLPRTTARS
jgi:hypothetical protein